MTHKGEWYVVLLVKYCGGVEPLTYRCKEFQLKSVQFLTERNVYKYKVILMWHLCASLKELSSGTLFKVVVLFAFAGNTNPKAGVPIFHDRSTNKGMRLTFYSDELCTYIWNFLRQSIKWRMVSRTILFLLGEKQVIFWYHKAGYVTPLNLYTVSFMILLF